MRNGDFAPSRLDAQQDAVNLLAGAKTGSNPENTVGVLSMAMGVEVRVAMTSDVGKVLAQSHGVKLGGEINLSAGLQVAGLALKHRQNKNQRQRVIVFVGSPVKEEEAALVKLGKKLKKNSVAVDIVNFGEEAENTQKLEALLNAVNSDDNSHLVTVPPGPHVLSDILLSSPIVQGEDGGGGGGGGMPTGGGGGGGEFAEFGVDPTLDPEFAWALRVSMEEERARQARAAEAEAGGEGGGGDAAAAGDTTAAAASTDTPMADAPADGAVDEAALLEAAIAMSQSDSSLVTPDVAAPAVTPGAPAHQQATAATEPTPAAPAVPADVAMGDADADEDEAMQLALAMSMSQEAQPAAAPAAPPAAGGADMAAMFQDPAFVQQVLGSLPGVDPSDPRIQSVLSSMPPSEEDKKEGDDKKEGGSS
jgi:26S proteasome regulatory subunit N10